MIIVITRSGETLCVDCAGQKARRDRRKSEHVKADRPYRCMECGRPLENRLTEHGEFETKAMVCQALEEGEAQNVKDIAKLYDDLEIYKGSSHWFPDRCDCPEGESYSLIEAIENKAIIKKARQVRQEESLEDWDDVKDELGL